MSSSHSLNPPLNAVHGDLGDTEDAGDTGDVGRGSLHVCERMIPGLPGRGRGLLRMDRVLFGELGFFLRCIRFSRAAISSSGAYLFVLVESHHNLWNARRGRRRRELEYDMDVCTKHACA